MNMYFLHECFGSDSYLNDINVLKVDEILAEEFTLSISYVTRTIPYNLAEGIQPESYIFVQNIR